MSKYVNLNDSLNIRQQFYDMDEKHNLNRKSIAIIKNELRMLIKVIEVMTYRIDIYHPKEENE